MLEVLLPFILFFFSSRRRHTRFSRDWSSDVCSSDLKLNEALGNIGELLQQSGVKYQQAEEEQNAAISLRSEERRVGKEGRSRWAPDHQKVNGLTQQGRNSRKEK